MIMFPSKDLETPVVPATNLELGAGDGGRHGHPLPARRGPQAEHHVPRHFCTSIFTLFLLQFSESHHSTKLILSMKFCKHRVTFRSLNTFVLTPLCAMLRIIPSFILKNILILNNKAYF